MVKYGKGTSRHLSELTQSGFSWKSGTSDPMSPMADGLAMKFHLDPYLCVIFLVWNYCLSRSILNGGKHLTIWQE
jgi:hypothetical protein